MKTRATTVRAELYVAAAYDIAVRIDQICGQGTHSTPLASAQVRCRMLSSSCRVARPLEYHSHAQAPIVLAAGQFDTRVQNLRQHLYNRQAQSAAGPALIPIESIETGKDLVAF